MGESLSKKDLEELEGIGELELDPETHQIARFGELIDKLAELIATNNERTKADLARSQVQLEILATLQKSLRQQPQGVTKLQAAPIDLGPLQEIIKEVVHREALAYTFDIRRGPNGGPMQQVIATPIQPTQH